MCVGVCSSRTKMSDAEVLAQALALADEYEKTRSQRVVSDAAVSNRDPCEVETGTKRKSKSKKSRDEKNEKEKKQEQSDNPDKPKREKKKRQKRDKPKEDEQKKDHGPKSKPKSKPKRPARDSRSQHPAVGHSGVSITADGKLPASEPEAPYHYADYRAASKLMLTGANIKLPQRDGKPYLPMVQTDRDQYELNNSPATADYRRAFDVGLDILIASDVGLNTTTLPKWAPEHAGSDKAHFRLADPGHGFAVGLPAFAWAHSQKTAHTLPFLSGSNENESVLLYVAGIANKQISTEPYLEQFVPGACGIPRALIFGCDAFVQREREVLDDTTVAPDGDKASAKKVRELRRNLIYVNGLGTLDHVFHPSLFPAMHTLMGFCRGDMMYAPVEAQLPEAFQIALGKSELSKFERRTFLKSYFVEDMLRHFSFDKSRCANADFIKYIAELNHSELKDAAPVSPPSPSTPSSSPVILSPASDSKEKESSSKEKEKEALPDLNHFGQFDDFLVLLRLFESDFDQRCIKVRTSHRSLAQAVEKAKEESKVPAVVPAAPAAAAATAAAAAPAPVPDAKTATPAEPAPKQQEVLYSMVGGRRHHYWAWTLQRIPPEWKKRLEAGRTDDGWTCPHKRLAARRIVALWDEDLKSPRHILKVPPGHAHPIIYQEDVRMFIQRFGMLCVGWNYRKRRTFGRSQALWSAFPCPGATAEKHDHKDCTYGLYVHHLIDELPLPLPPELIANTGHELKPLVDLLMRPEYQETSIRFRAAAPVPTAAVKDSPKEKSEKKQQKEKKDRAPPPSSVTWSREMKELSESERSDLNALHDALKKLDGAHKLSEAKIQMLMDYLAGAPRKARSTIGAVVAMMKHAKMDDKELSHLIESLKQARRSFAKAK